MLANSEALGESNRLCHRQGHGRVSDESFVSAPLLQTLVSASPSFVFTRASLSTSFVNYSIDFVVFDYATVFEARKGEQ